MSEMLCTSDGKMDATVLKMWHDGLKEIRCKADDKITFEEFKKFLKGQAPKDAMLSNLRSGDPALRRSSRKLINSSFALRAVQEGSTATKTLPDATDKILSFNGLKPVPSKAKATRAISVVLQPTDSMVRDGDDDYDLPSIYSTGSNRSEVPLHPESEAFRLRLDFRLSVLHASKLFDQKRQSRYRLKPDNPAGLTMVGGARRPSMEVRNAQDGTHMAAASKRSGRRNRYNKKKTKSDLSLLLRSIEQ